MKKKLVAISVFSCLLSGSLFFSGCDKKIDTIKESSKHVGSFMSIFEHNIKYECDEQIQKLDDNDKFSCTSFPIAFYLNNEKLGEIDSLHRDGYVFLQDIVQVIDIKEKNIKMASR